MTKSRFYNEVAEMNNYEVITVAQAESFTENNLLDWWEFDTDGIGRETIAIAIRLEGEEKINRVFIIAA